MISITPERLSGVIGSIYEATHDPTRWAVAIGNLENLFHGSKACFGRNGPDIQADDTVATRPDPEFQRRFVEEHARQPNAYVDVLVTAPVRMVYRDHALMGGDTLKRSRFLNEWMAPQDMYNGLGSKVLQSGPSFWYFDVQRGRHQEQFEATDTELLQVIVPHLARAAEINWKISIRPAFGIGVFPIAGWSGCARQPHADRYLPTPLLKQPCTTPKAPCVASPATLLSPTLGARRCCKSWSHKHAARATVLFRVWAAIC